MIQKFRWINERDITTNENQISLQNKINELVDAVNAIQTERESERFEIQEWIGILEAVRKSVNIHEKQIDELQMRDEELAERINYTLAKATDDKKALKLLDEKYKPVDPFAEQQRWIGKLCRFWDEKEEEKVFGILTTIDSDCGLSDMCPYWNDTTKNWFEHCEPVKDDIIYKGGDNVSE